MQPVLQYLSQQRNVYIIAKIRQAAQADSKLRTLLVSCTRPSKHGGMDWTSLALEIKMTVCEEQSKIQNETATAKITNWNNLIIGVQFISYMHILPDTE
jgi:hypothetical protein